MSDTNVSTETIETSRAVMAHHARSFQWAAHFLAPEDRDAAAVVYAFCRLVDDIADEHGDADELALLEREVLGEAEPRPLVRAFLTVCDERRIDIRSATELIEGVKSDLADVRIQSDARLLRYCYRVAGTVGLMMCGVLGVDDPKALAHAIDLGVAMQLTNICRDVLEDAERGRVYLPAHRLAIQHVKQTDLLDGTADRAGVAAVVRDLLELAETYYASAEKGFCYIPARSRFAIVVASRLYRAIGRKLLRRHRGDALRGRTIVHGAHKSVLVAASFFHYIRPSFLGIGSRANHDRNLHRALRGLPGVSH